MYSSKAKFSSKCIMKLRIVSNDLFQWLFIKAVCDFVGEAGDYHNRCKTCGFYGYFEKIPSLNQ